MIRSDLVNSWCNGDFQYMINYQIIVFNNTSAVIIEYSIQQSLNLSKYYKSKYMNLRRCLLGHPYTYKLFDQGHFLASPQYFAVRIKPVNVVMIWNITRIYGKITTNNHDPQLNCALLILHWNVNLDAHYTYLKIWSGCEFI